MLLLDTNVISELRRARPHGAVLAWFKELSGADVNIAAATIGEIQSGIEITRESDTVRAEELEKWLSQVSAAYNILSMNAETFRIWAKLMHRKQDHLSSDAMVAATALQHKLIVVTRNTKDFSTFGVKLFNPFLKA